MWQEQRPAKVLIVDDSATVRQVFAKALKADPDLEVVGVAPDPYVARDMILHLQPDVLTLDLEMPRMDGMTFLGKLMKHHPLPVVVVSSLTPEKSSMALDAMRAGAVDVHFKHGQAHSVGDMLGELIDKVKAASRANVKPILNPVRRQIQTPKLRETTNKLVALGCSTGGTQALERILPTLPSNFPGLLIVQHMPERFTKTFAERLNGICSIEIKEAEEGDSVINGRALIAPGNQHLQLVRSGARYLAHIHDAPRVRRHRPSVDVLFDSVAEHAGKNAVGVILTGMGDDGARGMQAMKAAGAHTIAQDESTSVVFGMPARAIERNCVDQILPIDEIPPAMIQAVQTARSAA